MVGNLLLSVIVPVYNVQKYLAECIDSIINQSYSQYELIIVDDGSTDKSRSICEYYSTLDEKIKVIHQENQGLSAARNAGLLSARGRYVIFIDSDDIITKDCFKESINKIESSKADLVLFKYRDIKDVKDIKNNYSITEPEFPIGTYSGIDACKFLFQRKYENYSWRILAKRRVYIENNILFPVNRAYEDRATTYKLLLRSERVCFLDKYLYFYRQRNDSIIHTISYKNLHDDFLNLEERLVYIKENVSSLNRLCLANTYCAYIGIYRNLIDVQDDGLKRIIANKILFPSIFYLPSITYEKRIQLFLIKVGLMDLVKPLINFLKRRKNE